MTAATQIRENTFWVRRETQEPSNAAASDTQEQNSNWLCGSPARVHVYLYFVFLHATNWLA
jgi:hypothetical protein